MAGIKRVWVERRSRVQLNTQDLTLWQRVVESRVNKAGKTNVDVRLECYALE
jgi:hypothetical protein